MKYIWDPIKAKSNFKKHRISFELATTLFDDIHHLSVPDSSSKGLQGRWVSVGLASDRQTLLVVHTYTESYANEAIRIISARKATKHEKRQYEEGV